MGNTGNTETQKRMPHIQIPENLGIAYAVLPGVEVSGKCGISCI